MTAWPSTLPQTPLRNGFSQSQQDNAIRSAMSYGPDKVRRRTTVAIKQVSVNLILSQSQVAELDTFYNTTLDVAGSFDWTDHVSGQSATYRFMQPPAYAPTGKQLWATSLQLEIVP